MRLDWVEPRTCAGLPPDSHRNWANENTMATRNSSMAWLCGLTDSRKPGVQTRFRSFPPLWMQWEIPELEPLPLRYFRTLPPADSPCLNFPAKPTLKNKECSVLPNRAFSFPALSVRRRSDHTAL